jgi:methionyl-tRNA formyltransferase
MDRVVFVGSKRIGLRSLSAMQAVRPGGVAGIITPDDTSDTRHAFEDIKAFGARHGVPVVVPPVPRDVHDAVRQFEPDLVIVCGWYWMIEPRTLALAQGRFIGVHNSLLPAYRGSAPLVWAMLNGESRVGVSMYTLTNSMDDGDIWGQADTTVGPDDYIGCVLARVEEACEEMIARVLPRILDGSAVPTAQDEARASFGAPRTREDGCVRWSDSAEGIYRAVRAQSRPYPGAFTTLGNRRLTIWKAHPFRPRYFGRPGDVKRGPNGEVLVLCGDGRALVLDEVQFQDGERGPAVELLRVAGTRLGQ